MDYPRVFKAIKGALSNLSSFKVDWNEGADTTGSINHDGTKVIEPGIMGDGTAGPVNDDVNEGYEKLG